LPWATKPPPTTLPPAPTNERLSFAVDQFTGSGHGYLSRYALKSLVASTKVVYESGRELRTGVS
ncbi:hypothetical protein, partial [Mycobacterium kansasii]